MKLAIADPPYPPRLAERHDLAGGRTRTTTRSRARRYYGDGTRSSDQRPADFHPDAGDWDDPARHRQLLLDLVRDYDGWAIATTPDGLAAYGELPIATRLLAWVKPNGVPSGSRLRGTWEVVIVRVPEGRRGRNGGPSVPDTLVASHRPSLGFAGAKPPEWTRWILDALGFDPALDTVDDLFPGSGAVGRVVAELAATS